MAVSGHVTLGWGGIARLCLTNTAIGALAALPVNLFNRLMTVELAWPAILPGLLVALHYGVQFTRPYLGPPLGRQGGADAVHPGRRRRGRPWADRNGLWHRLYRQQPGSP
jgi:hypothetical protein